MNRGIYKLGLTSNKWIDDLLICTIRISQYKSSWSEPVSFITDKVLHEIPFWWQNYFYECDDYTIILFYFILKSDCDYKILTIVSHSY